MKVPSPGEFEHASLSWLSASLGWLAGVERRRLLTHRACAQTVVKAIGITMVTVSAPVACAAMTCFIYENAGALPALERAVLAGVGGIAWAGVAIIGIDRSLMIVGDAIGIGRWRTWALSLLIRGSLTVVTASLFSEMVVEAQFAGISEETSQHIALTQSELDAGRIARLEGVPQAKAVANALDGKAKDLKWRYDTLPVSVRSANNAAIRCDNQVKDLQRSLGAALARPDAADSIVSLETALADKKVLCRDRHLEAARRKDAYLNPIAAEIADNDTARKSATTRLNTVSAKAADRTAALDQITRDGYGSLSGRKVGFERAKELYPEVRRSALLWWIAFFAAELMPLVLRAMLLNNPPAAEAQADLAEEAGRHRNRARRAAIMEKQFNNSIGSPEVQAAMAGGMIPNIEAIEHLAGHEAFLAELSRSQARQQAFANAHPDLAGQSHEAYMEAVARAIDALSRRPWSPSQ